MTKPIPSAAMKPEFLAEVRAGFVRQEPTAQRLALAAHDTDLAMSYLEQALALSRQPIRDVLFGLIEGEPEEGEPDHRASAALLFLHGVGRGYWTADAQEAEQARAHVIARYGAEAFMTVLQKTKDDLAREAGLPTKSFTYRRKPEGRNNGTRPENAVKDIIRISLALEQAAAHMIVRSAAPGATAVTKLEAVQEYLRAMEALQPGAWEKWCADHPEFIAAARELARRTLQEAENGKA